MRVFSGIKPTGEATLGTILGAIKPWTEMQGPEAFFCIVDLHALTVPQDPAQLRELTYDIAATFIAVGIDPGRTNMFIQGQVPAHRELAWLLECTATFGELQRMTQFKDKSRKNISVSAGLFTYPVLMAADILLYQAEAVPVGEDQVQHVELTRDLAQRFNARFGDIFTLPSASVQKAGARIRDLQHPENKMSKSEDSGGTILITDDLSVVRRRVMRAVTDADGEVRYDFENKPGVSNLLAIYASIENVDAASVADKFSSYKDLKTTVADRVCDFLAPIQKRRSELLADRAELDRLLAQGRAKAQPIAVATLNAAQDALGLIQ
ncbi:MAG TPA: tryptophan--tRNA ligase [Trebonia sp.]|nr:tryptophan--tRNA ligase [Trebonia sp.]